MSVISPVQSHDHEGSPMSKEEKLVEVGLGRICWKGSFRAWSEGVMDDESGDDDKDGLTSDWGGESRQDLLGWWNKSGSWFQWRGNAYLNERFVIYNEEKVVVRQRVTTDEEWYCRGVEWRIICCR